jgi:hypothetical protein
MENRVEIQSEIRESFYRGWRKVLSEETEKYPTLGISKINEVDPKEAGHPNTLLMHKLEFNDHSKINIRLVQNNPDDVNIPSKLLNLLKGKKEINPNYPFVVVEYQILKSDSQSSNKKYFKEFGKLLSPILNSTEKLWKPKTMDELIWGKAIVRKDNGIIPAKVGISDNDALTVYISQPLYWFWDNYIHTRDSLGDYMSVWIRSIKNVIPKVYEVAKKWAYK